MTESPKYTVAVCNYNMADTLEESLRSILDQLDDRFEVLVIDDGSTDGSQKILDKLEDKYKILRWIEGDNKNIGEARAQANKEAKGEYILVQFDADDLFEPVIQDLVKIYHIIEESREKDLFFANIGPKSLLTDINYRSMGRGEDRDLWKRLMARGYMIEFEPASSYHESLGYDYTKIGLLRNGYEEVKNIFKSGVRPWSYVFWKISNAEYRDDLFRAFISPFAYIHALIEGRYNLPEEYDDYRKFGKKRNENHLTLSEIENKYDIDLYNFLSDKSKKILYS